MISELCVLAAFSAAGFVHGVAGFGAGIVAMAIMPAAFEMMDAVPIVTVLWLLVTLLLLSGDLRSALDSPGVRATIPPLITGAYVGVPLGIELLTSVDPPVLRLGLGVSMLLFVVERILHDVGWLGHAQSTSSSAAGRNAAWLDDEDPWLPLTPDTESTEGESSPERFLLADERYSAARTASRALVAVLVGVASGMLSGALNEGGPPVVIFLALQGWRKDDVKAALQLYFLLMTMLQLGLLWQRGLLAPRHLYFDAVGLPAVVASIALGARLYARIDQRAFGRLLIGAMLWGGGAYVVDSGRKLAAD